MSDYKIEIMTDLPILFVSYDVPFQMGRDLDSVLQEVHALLDKMNEPVYFVSDIRNVANFTINDLLEGTNKALHSGNAVVGHPNVLETLLITESKLFKLTADGLRTATFGRQSVWVFETPDDAFDYVRARLP